VEEGGNLMVDCGRIEIDINNNSVANMLIYFNVE
jgi:hypothetical protein